MKTTQMNKNSTTRSLALVLAVLLGSSVVGCATIEGAGKDIESAGEAIQDAADKN